MEFIVLIIFGGNKGYCRGYTIGSSEVLEFFLYLELHEGYDFMYMYTHIYLFNCSYLCILLYENFPSLSGNNIETERQN